MYRRLQELGVDVTEQLQSDPLAIYDESYWRRLANESEAALSPVFQGVAWEGIQAGEAQMGFEVAWDLLNQDVLDFTNRYTFDLIKLDGDMSIIQHTRDQVRETFEQWQRGELGEQGFPDLVAGLEPLFGRMRAQRIAATEATRLFSWGNQEAWRAGGVVNQKTWKTAADDLVCPICMPLNGKTVDLNATFTSDLLPKPISGPPAHVNCRCWLTGTVREDDAKPN